MAIETLEYGIAMLDEEGKEIKKPKPINARRYVLLLFYVGGDKIFEIITGQEESYDFIREIVEDIDLKASQILGEDSTIKTCKNIYDFIKAMRPYVQDPMDPDDYIIDSDDIEVEDDYNQIYVSPIEGSIRGMVLNSDIKNKDI